MKFAIFIVRACLPVGREGQPAMTNYTSIKGMNREVVIEVLLEEVIAVVELHRRENDRGYFSERLTNQSIIIWTLKINKEYFKSSQ